MILPQSSSFVRQEKNLTGVKRILKSFIDQTEIYEKHTNNDLPCIYTELASVAFFYACAMKEGWTGLPEFQHQKKDVEKKKRATRSGRCDLYLSRFKDGNEFYCEAKQSFVKLAKGSSYEKMFSNVKDSAISDCDISRKSGWKRKNYADGLALNFFGIHVPKEVFCTKEKMGLNFIKYLEESYDAGAWYFTKQPAKDWEKNIFVGQAIGITIRSGS